MTAREWERFLPYGGILTSSDLWHKTHVMMLLTNRMDADEPLTCLDDEGLLNLLNESEAMSVGIRRALVNKQMLPDRDLPPLRPPYGLTANLQVKVSYSGGVLTVSCPPTFLRDMKDSWVLPAAVRTALRLHCEKHGVPRVPAPAFAVCVRKASAYRNGYRDNENFESSRIINVVMECLGYTDRPDHLGYASIFRKVGDPEESGVDFIFLPLEKLKERPELLDF